MTGVSQVGVIGCLVAMSAVACSGYADLSLPVRQSAQATVESQELFPGRLGTVQLRLSLASGDAPVSPLWVVGAPDIVATNASDISWAYGPCGHPGAPTDALGPEALRLCVAVSMREGPGAGAPFTIFVVVEDRGAQARYAAVAEVIP